MDKGILEFLTTLRSDTELLHQLAIQAVKLGREHGFDFSEEEFRGQFRAELSETELDGIAGGGCGNIFTSNGSC